jgi:hypothetical protein
VTTKGLHKVGAEAIDTFGWCWCLWGLWRAQCQREERCVEGSQVHGAV